MMVTFRGRQVEIVEVSMTQYDKLAVGVDALNAFAQADLDGTAPGSAVAKWRERAAVFIETARMVCPSLTDQDIADASVRDLFRICVAGWKANASGRIMQEEAGEAVPAVDPKTAQRRQVEGFTNLMRLTGGQKRADLISDRMRVLEMLAEVRPDAMIAVEGNG